MIIDMFVEQLGSTITQITYMSQVGVSANDMPMMWM